jgi:hypothetical protein
VTRKIGDKGQPKETDRQIVFTILLNQLRNQIGLTKKQISETVETVTQKDQDGVRKKVAYLLNDSELSKKIIQRNVKENRTFHQIRLKNLKDVAIFANFMGFNTFEHVGEGAEILRHFIFKHFNIFFDQIIDYLYLWDPFSGPYSLPMELQHQLKKSGYLSFYPERYKDFGPTHLKEVLRRSNVFHWLQDKEELNLTQLFHLIQNIEEIRNQDSKYAKVVGIPIKGSRTSRENWFVDDEDELEMDLVDFSREMTSEFDNSVVQELSVFLKKWGDSFKRAVIWEESLDSKPGSPIRTGDFGKESVKFPSKLIPYEGIYHIYPGVEYVEEDDHYQFETSKVEGVTETIGISDELKIPPEQKLTNIEKRLEKWIWKK